jgi:GNAT superfamily N-acetyltransferase
MPKLGPVPIDARKHLRPLFAAFPGLHGAIDSAIEGLVGDVYADDPDAPRVGQVSFDDFHCLGGDPTAPAAREAVLSAPRGHNITAAESWQDLIRSREDVREKQRFAFSAPPSWDFEHLAKLRTSLQPGLTLQRVKDQTIDAFEALERSLIANFSTHANFLARGVGFGITNESGEFVAGCASYTISSRSLEFEIQTRPDHQRRGLALVTGARMIEHCLENGLEPCWDAAHEGSALLAERLGFVNRRPYTAYQVS